MDYVSHLFPAPLLIAASLFSLALLFMALVTAPWSQLRQGEQRHVFLGTTVVVMLLWSMHAGISPGLNYHLIGATVMVLMFGWQLALLSLFLVLFATTMNGQGDWGALALNFLLFAALPVAASQLLLLLATRRLPQNFFIYALFNGYLAGGVAMLGSLTLSSLLLLLFGPYTYAQLIDEFLPFAPFIAFGEAFISGMLVAGLVLERPGWLHSFDDRRYLNGK